VVLTAGVRSPHCTRLHDFCVTRRGGRAAALS